MVVVKERGRRCHGAGSILHMPVMLKALSVRNVVALMELRTTDLDKLTTALSMALVRVVFEYVWYN